MKVKNTGRVLEIKDGIALVDGLSEVGLNELVTVNTASGTTVAGLALNLEADRVGVVIIGDYLQISEGDLVETTGKLVSINVSDAILGRVIDPLGRPLDGKGPIDTSKGKIMPLQKIAPGVIDREDVSRPVQTGIKSIDAMIPIGRGQRQLIIGDRQTGKTAIAIDTIINQAQAAKEQGLPLVKCVYVAIGQKQSKIAQLIAKLEQAGAMEYTTVVMSGASDAASMQYLAPNTGAAIGEYFAERGEDALVVFDDLTKHAWAYREISLLLRRPPGREAYPGDIFYLHSALLERGVQFSKARGGGSVTMLPVIETQANDVSAYIPTNVISITDGQIYLEADLFNAGVRPAVNVGISVSRVGGSAQIKPMKQVAGQLRLDLAQYRALAAFAQFGSDLDEATKKQLSRGDRMVELLKQNQYAPMSVADQIMLLFAGTRGYLDKIPVTEVNEEMRAPIDKEGYKNDVQSLTVKSWEAAFLRFIHDKHQDILGRLAKGEKIESELEKKLIDIIEGFNAKWQ